jgi:hypothetical protein
MRIDSGGNVGIGTSSPSGVLDIRNGGTQQVIIGNSGTYAGGEYGELLFKEQSTELARVKWNPSGNTFQLINNIAGPMTFATSGTERMRIDSSGNVGIGTAATPEKLSIEAPLSTLAGLGLTYSGATKAVFSVLPSTGEVRIGGTAANYFPTFYSSGTERMRIDSSGNLLVAGTSAISFGIPSLQIGGSNGNALVTVQRNITGSASQIRFYNPNGTVGEIYTSGSSTVYATSSDYRLKENVTADWDATTRLKQLNPVRFNFIADADTTVDGFLAHEVQDIVPEAISGTKDGMRDEEYTVSAATGDIYTSAVEATYDDDGVELTAAVDEVIYSTDVERPEELAEGQQWRETTAAVMGTRSVPDYQGIDQSKLVPLLVKTIQELEARITALETA